MALVSWYHGRYRSSVAVNLRLPAELAERLRAQAEEEGRSQQAVMRDALENYLRDVHLKAFPPEIRHLLLPPKRPFSMARRREHPIPELGHLSSVEVQAILDDLNGR